MSLYLRKPNERSSRIVRVELDLQSLTKYLKQTLVSYEIEHHGNS